MSTSLGHKVASSAIALTLAFGLSACGESDLDLQRKPDLVDLMADRAVATCVIQKSEMDQIPYEARLRELLMETSSTALDFFKENNITVCLDKRLQNQDNGFLGDYEAYGVYYPEQKILSLWDNGKGGDQKSWYESSAETYGPKFLREFAKGTFGGYFSDYKSVEDVTNPMLAHTYRCCGKSATRRYEWDALSSPDGKTLGTNVFLQTAPSVTLQ